LNIFITGANHFTALSFSQLGEELWFTIGGQHIPFGASPQV
jgi:hypothetical protein